MPEKVNGTNGAGHHAYAPSRPPLEPARLFDGARLVVIGGTGFLGKIFWLMLLDRYPAVGKIFLLVRSSKTHTSEERFWDSVVASDAFAPLRETHGGGLPAFLREKIVPIDGDIGKPLCGLDEGLLRELRGTVDAVVNVAGIVDFNPPLDDALHANAFGAQNLVALARALGSGPSSGVPLFHTSTCYVAGTRPGPIHEDDPTRYPFPRADELGRELWDPDREIAECLDLISQARHRADDAFRQSEFEERAKKNLARKAEPAHGAPFEEELARVKRKYVSERLVEAGLDRATHWGWPNIYTYTKSIGEQVIARSGLPFTIARPACCESTLTFPLRGWNEGINTSAPMAFMMMKGLVQVPARHVPLDFIPTDLVTAGMIMALAELLEGSAKPVYQFGASDVNPVTAARLGELIGLYKRKHYQRKGKGNPLVNALQAHVEPVFISSRQFGAIGTPAVAGASRALAGFLKRAPALRPLATSLEAMGGREDKIADILRLFEPFTCSENGPFSCANTRAAYARLPDADRAKLRWAPEDMDWADWMHEVHMPALEKYVFPVMERKLRREMKPLRAHRTLASLVFEMAERHDLGVALQRLEADGFTRVTYRDVLARADAAAARLAARGIVKGDCVVLSGNNHPDWAIAYFGIMRAGATAVPVDPGLDALALANVVRESGAKAAIVDTAVRAKLGAGLAVVLDQHEATEADPTLDPPDVEVLPEDIASLIFTSGTTGTPKGVRLTHGNFTALIAALGPLFPLGAKDRVLSVLPLHHTFEFTCGLLLPLSAGSRIAYLDELNGDRLMKGLRLGKVTAMVGVPALWQLLERRIVAQVKAKGPVAESVFNFGTDLNRVLRRRLGVDAGKLLFSPVHQALGGRVRYLISGGAALPADTQKLFAGLGLPLVEGYGLTEAAPVLTVSKMGSKPGQVGKAVPGVELSIERPDESGVGEVLARGPNVMAGYTDAAATKAAIDDAGWLHTGDLGKIDGKGQLTIVGRLKDVIVTTTGENVYPDDVEQRIGTVDQVTELAVVGVHATGGERVACLAVVLHAEEGDRREENDRAMRSLRAAIGKLAYREQPAVIYLYDAPLPRTATRKVKRGDVRAILERMMAASEAGKRDGGDGRTTFVRRAIAAIKGKDALAIAPSATLKDDLGFDSLALSELHVSLEAQVGAVDSHALLACSTVADVERLVGAQSVAPPTRKRAAPEEDDAGVSLTLPPAVQAAGKSFIGKLQDTFYGQIMNARVYGRAHIPHNRNAIVIANHSSHLDMGFVRHALGTYGADIVSLAAQDYFFDKSPLRRAFFENLTNLKAIDRKGSLRASERAAAEVLEAGKTMLIFPEGTRSEDSEVHEFKALLGHLALAYGVDILPMFIQGTREAMPKGAPLPIKRDLVARIGPPLCLADMKRLTLGMTPSDASREIARLARAAVIALRDGAVLDLAAVKRDSAAPVELEERAHPLVALFAELETKFKPGRVAKPISFYFTLGGDAMAKWTVKVNADNCEIRPGKPAGGAADCVLKTSPEIFTRIVRDAYTPGAAEFLSGAIKSNDVELLFTFQKAFELG